MKNLIKTFEGFTADDYNSMERDYHDKMNMEPQNYMFFGDLMTIKRCVDQMLQMDKAAVDEILKNGHDWAENHIATSKDDIEEVCGFLMNELGTNNMYPGSTVMEETHKGSMYSCNECGSMYEAHEWIEDMSCENCGGLVSPLEEGWGSAEESKSYSCNECGSIYEAHECNETMTCENCGCKLTESY